MEDRASRRTVAATALVLVAVAALLVVALTGGSVRRGSADRLPPTADRAVPRDVTVADALASLTVLRDWDRARAAAWRDGDTDRLTALYTRRSEAGRRDVAMLERWTARGLRVRGMAMQVLAVDLLHRTDRRIVLEVTDRLADPVAVGRGRRWALPRDGVSVRRLELRRPTRTGDRWLLATVGPR